MFDMFTEAVDDLMVETHELGGSTVVVDRATPKVAFKIIFFTSYVEVSISKNLARFACVELFV